jgi:hypothetical protein
MSIDYRFRNPVPFANIKNFKSKLVKVVLAPDADPDDHVCLTDGTNYLHAYTGDGTDTGLTRYTGNDPSAILAALQRAFGEILSEFGDDFFEDEEELPEDAAPGFYVGETNARGQAMIRTRLPEEDK